MYKRIRERFVMLLLFFVLLMLAGCVEINNPDNEPVTDNNFTFNAANPGVCNVIARATGSIECNTKDINWTLTAIAGSIQTSNPNPARGGRITFTYTGLPAINSEFGNKILRAKDNHSDTETVQIFFSKEVTNHPGAGAGIIPNWYFYWTQTSANHGTHSWESGSETGVTRFEGGRWRAFLRNANESAAAGTWSRAEGIDFFAHMCRHEDRHRLDMIALWGANSDRIPDQDRDNDYLPDEKEADLVNKHPYDPTLFGTYPDTFNYGQNPLRDCEDYALRRQNSWHNGSANNEDWANPGHQTNR